MKVKEESEKIGLKQHSDKEDHGIWSHHFMANRREKVETVADFIFLGSKIPVVVTAAMNLKDACSLEEKQ